MKLKKLIILSLSLTLCSCFDEKKKVKIDKQEKVVASDIASGDLTSIAQRRGLTEEDLLAAVETFVPSGGRDDFVGFFGTGSGGKAAVFTIPSMRLLKYIGVFTPEPWQGFAYDDSSKAMIDNAGRDEIRYDFGDMGRPALSVERGMIDGLQAFFADAANGRVALVDLDDYETKTILVNPYFHTSRPSLSSTENTEYVVQTADAPELLEEMPVLPSGDALAKAMRGGLTFWRVRGDTPTQGHAALTYDGSFSVELPPYLQSDATAGRGPGAGFVFTIASCADASLKLGQDKNCTSPETRSTLQVIDWRKAASLAQTKSQGKTSLLRLDELNSKNILIQWRLPNGAESMQLSADGNQIAVISRSPGQIYIIDTARLLAGSPATTKDEFGLATGDLAADVLKTISIDGIVSGVAFGQDETIFASVTSPGRLVRLDTKEGKLSGSLTLGFEPSSVFLPSEKDMRPSNKYAVVTNPRPHARLTSVGPSLAINPQLIDISSKEMRVLYDMALPQANAFGGVAWDASVGAQIVRYKPGTDTRTGKISPFKTLAGQEKIVREGNHVHIFATLIRSHITPEIIEVGEGETVSIHLTNLEQAQDQTHGFTVDTYNVHGSWEPGKTASVTFVADRPGVFPYYCTEFCSALHLEMEGYLLVKPKGWKPSKEAEEVEVIGDAAHEKLAYDNKMQAIKDTGAVIDEVVTWLKAHNYEKDPRAAALVKDALDQLGQTAAIQERINKAIKDENWGSARLWAEQYFQYQVKAADAGLKAKKILTEAEGN